MDGACGGDEPCDEEIVGLMENGQTTGISECLGGVGEAMCRLRLVWRPETIFTVCVMTFNRWTSLWWRERESWMQVHEFYQRSTWTAARFPAIFNHPRFQIVWFQLRHDSHRGTHLLRKYTLPRNMTLFVLMGEACAHKHVQYMYH